MSNSVVNQWRAVECIPFGRVRADDKESLLTFVEEPLREAVGIMYEKNLPTIGSSCNVNDYIKGHSWITVDYEFMTARNRKVTDRYEHVEKFELFNQILGKIVVVAGLLFPIEQHDLPTDIGGRAVELAKKFYDQPNFLPKNV